MVRILVQETLLSQCLSPSRCIKERKRYTASVSMLLGLTKYIFVEGPCVVLSIPFGEKKYCRTIYLLLFTSIKWPANYIFKQNGDRKTIICIKSLAEDINIADQP